MSNDSEACKAGGAASAATVAGIGTAAAGSSAAAMTTTLATIGSTVGGGMAAGIGLVTAAPIAAGVLVYGLYKLFND